MIYSGDFRTSDTVYFSFNSINQNGSPTSMAGSPAVQVIKNDSAGSPSTAGLTFTTDAGGITGLNTIKIDTSADGTFYSTGADFFVVISSGTILGFSQVGMRVGRFSIENRSAVRPTVKNRNLDISSGGKAGIDLANIGSPTTVVDLSGLTIKNVNNAVPGVSGNVTGSVASVTAAVTVGTNNDKTGYALSTAGVQAIWDALTSALTTVGSIGKLLVTNIDATISSRLASASYTVPPTASAIAQAVWDFLTSASSVVGSFGLLVKTNIDALISSRNSTSHFDTIIGNPANGNVSADIALVRSQVDGIKNKTDNLPSDPASNTHVDTETNLVLSRLGSPSGASVSADINQVKTVVDDTNTKVTAKLDVAVSTRLAAASYVAPDNTTIGNIKTELDDVKAKTDNLPSDPASTTDVNTRSSQNSVNTLQTTATAIKAKTDQLLFDSDTGVIAHVINQTPLNPSDIADAVWDADLVDHTAAGTFGANAQNPPLDPTDVADAVWDALLVNHTVSGSFGANAQNPPLDPSQIADAVWDAATDDHMQAGTFGLAVQNNSPTEPTTNAIAVLQPTDEFVVIENPESETLALIKMDDEVI